MRAILRAGLSLVLIGVLAVAAEGQQQQGDTHLYWVSTAALPRSFPADSTGCRAEAEKLAGASVGRDFDAEWKRCFRERDWALATKREVPATCQPIAISWLATLPGTLDSTFT